MSSASSSSSFGTQLSEFGEFEFEFGTQLSEFGEFEFECEF